MIWTIIVSFVGVYAYMAWLCARADAAIDHLRAIRGECNYIALMVEGEIKRRDKTND